MAAFTRDSQIAHLWAGGTPISKGGNCTVTALLCQGLIKTYEEEDHEPWGAFQSLRFSMMLRRTKLDMLFVKRSMAAVASYSEVRLRVESQAPTRDGEMDRPRGGQQIVSALSCAIRPTAGAYLLPCCGGLQARHGRVPSLATS